MIQYIKLKNYRTFTDLNFELGSKNGLPNKLALIYGENGSGKSTLISVFDVLFDSFHTMSIRRLITRFLEDHPDDNNTQQIAALKSFTDITRLIKRNKTVGSSDNMSIEIGFHLNGKNGSYFLEFDSNQIVHEKLEYTLKKNRGIYFDVTKNNLKINSSIFSDFKTELNNLINKFWGKHSVIALLNNAHDEYSSDYLKTNLSPSLRSTLSYLNSFYIYFADSASKGGIISDEPTLSPEQYPSGELPESDLYRLDTTEKMLNTFFTSISKNTLKVFYKKVPTDDKIKYELFFTRFISGKEREISYSNESCGIQNLIYLLPYFLAATQGKIVVIDEIDNGIHDMLLSTILKKLYPNITGQVIISTHNTHLLNEYSFKDSFYFIEIDQEGNRRINQPSDFGYRIQPDSNVLINYLQDRFKGTPWTNMNIDFNAISYYYQNGNI